MKSINSRQAQIIAQALGRDISGDGITYYATNLKETEIYCFDSKTERDAFIKAYNDKFGQEVD